jgi:hypothetical protein
MEFQEIDTTGKIWVQRLASIPTWTTADKGRIIYNTANGYYYFGGASSWVIMTTGVNTTYLSRTTTDSHAGTIYPTVDAAVNLGGGVNRYANIYAVNFHGIATSAKYADVAEKYILKTNYPIGTVLKINDNENYEMRQVGRTDDLVSGVVSKNPGFILNSELEDGTSVALVGKTPVRVIGPVTKGDMIGPYDDGCGIKTEDRTNMFAIALESFFGEGVEELVMCLLKL